MNPEATYDYIDCDFAHVAETLRAYRTRTTPPSRPALARRVYRRISRVR
jgi:hypothetical protein